MKILRRLSFPTLFLIFGYWVLLGQMRPFLSEVADMTPFYTTVDFFTETLCRPAGAVFYLSSLLQSSMARPVLGATALLLLLVSMAYATKASLHIPGVADGLCWLPPLALLANFTQIGYLVYTVKMPAPAFTPVVGVLMALLTAWLLRTVTGQRATAGRVMASGLIIVTAFLGYCLLGAYILLAGLLYILSLATRPGTDRLFRLLQIFIAVISLWAVPAICYQQGWFHVRAADIYTQGLPDYLHGDTAPQLSAPLRTAFVLTGIYAVLPFRRLANRKMKWLIETVCALLFVAALWLAHAHAFRDNNFYAILEMKQALEAGDTDRVLQLSMQTTDEPTRAQIMLTRVALWQSGQADDKLFTYPDGCAAYNAPTDNQYLRLMVGRTLYYYLGKINYAYRWCMEDMVEYGRRPGYLMYMAKCAIVNGETRLANKYLSQLRHTLFYDDFANRYLQLLAAHRQDRQMQALKPLLRYADMVDGDGGMVEMYCLQSMALSEGGSREMVDISLMCNLITKNIAGFWPRFFQLLPTWKGHIPVHYQEAALLFAQLQGRPDISRLPIDPGIRQSFERLIQASAQNGDSQSNAVTLRPEFGGTYWYYYFFVEGLKTH